MEIEAAKKYVETLLDYQYDLLYVRHSWGVNHAEFIFIQTARVIIEHAEIRKWFFEKIEHTLFSQETYNTDNNTRSINFIPDDFIWFLAHMTRWIEFNDIANKISGKEEDTWKSNPCRKSSEVLLEALSDNWEDRDFYEEFTER